MYEMKPEYYNGINMIELMSRFAQNVTELRAKRN